MVDRAGRRAATILSMMLFVMLGRPAPASPAKLMKKQESALRERVDQMYKAWSAQDWEAMLKFMTPDIQACGKGADEGELGDEIGEWPVSWNVLAFRLDNASPHHKLSAECSAKVWSIDAVVWVRMTAAYKESDGSGKPEREFEQPWLLVENQWYFSLDEL